MTDKELHKLRREDLLQILLSQQEQIEALQKAIQEKDKALEHIDMQRQELERMKGNAGNT